jgi:hypothetical protein
MSASPLLRFHHQFTNAPERFGLSDVLGQKAVLNEFLLKPGSANAMRLKVVLKSQDACSQYLDARRGSPSPVLPRAGSRPQ